MLPTAPPTSINASEAPLLAAVQANPSDAISRAVYTDWLEQQDPVRAAVLRADDAFLHDDSDDVWEVLCWHLRRADPAWVSRACHRWEVELLDGEKPNRIVVIKHLRTHFGWGLKQAYDICFAAPCVMWSGLHGAHAGALLRLEGLAMRGSRVDRPSAQAVGADERLWEVHAPVDADDEAVVRVTDLSYAHASGRRDERLADGLTMLDAVLMAQHLNALDVAAVAKLSAPPPASAP